MENLKQKTIQEKPNGDKRAQYMVALCVSVATITMGMSSAWPTPVLIKLKNNETSIDITKEQIGWMLAMSAPGFVVGSFVSGFTADRLGRRATMLWSALPYGAGMILVASALHSWMLYITLFLWSCATGMLSTVNTFYCAEIADADIRGRVFMVTKVTFNLGSLLMMCIGPFLSFETLNYLLLVMPVSYFLACYWIPETPHYLLKEGKVDAARKALLRLRKYEDRQDVETDLVNLQSNVKKEMRRSSSPRELFTGRQYRTAVIIATGLKVTQIMTGAMTIQQYLGLIMEESGIGFKLSTIIIIFGFVRFVVSIMPSILVDKLGRRPLLIYSYIGTGLSLAIVGIYFFLLEVMAIDQASITPYGFITFTGIVSANIISTIGFQSLIHIIPGEIFPLNVKSTAMASLSIFGGVLSFIIARGYQALKDLIGLCGVFWVFAIVAFAGAAFSWWIVPETKGKTLRQIQAQLQGDLYEDDDVTKKISEVEMNGVLVDDDAHYESKELEVLNKKEDKPL